METTSVPEDKVIKIGDLSFHYLDWGNPDDVPIVLLHGLCGMPTTGIFSPVMWQASTTFLP